MENDGAEFLDGLAKNRPAAFSPKELEKEVLDLWERGLPPGESTGWISLDKHYTVAEGCLTVITGWPGSGKSEWLDALLVNLSKKGWKTAMFSPENLPVSLHISKLMEKFSGKPFGKGVTPRIPRDELTELMDDVSQSFAFIEAPHDQGYNAPDILKAAEPFLLRFINGEKRALVIDPWNELEHWRPKDQSETEYVSHTLSTIRKWANFHKVHVFIVAHPAKMRRDDGGKLPIPRPDMISGSQHWWNKADYAICVQRSQDDVTSPFVDIHIQKVRHKHIGSPGMVTLKYHKVTGQYSIPLTDVSADKRA